MNDLSLEAQQEEVALDDERLKEALRILRETLARHGTNRLVMVYDTTLGDPMGETISASGLPVLPLNIRNSEGLGQAVQLVDIDSEPRRERLVNESVRQALIEVTKPALPQQRARSVCAWLITNESLPDLKNVFEQRSRYFVSPQEHRILRFWDPRVTQHLKLLFPFHPLSSWLPKTIWLHVDSFGDWNFLPAPEEDSKTLEIQPDAGLLARTSLITLTLQYLSEDGLQHNRRILPKAIEAARIADELDFPDIEDAACFAAQRISYAKPLEQSARMQGILRRVRENGESYQNITADFDDDDWDAILKACTLQIQ